MAEFLVLGFLLVFISNYRRTLHGVATVRGRDQPTTSRRLLHRHQPVATELFQSPLYGSGTVFHSIGLSHLLRHFPSSALAGRHTSSNYVIRNYCCRAREVTLSFHHHHHHHQF